VVQVVVQRSTIETTVDGSTPVNALAANSRHCSRGIPPQTGSMGSSVGSGAASGSAAPAQALE
jgi:hypothetical protein